MRKGTRLTAGLAALCLLFSALLCGCGRTEPPLSAVISNSADIVASVREGLRNHARTITVTFTYRRDILSELTALAEDWVAQALQETDDPAEGDYIRYQYGGYEIRCDRTQTDDGYAYAAEITPKYYMYLVQEEAVSEKLAEVIESFGFDESTSDYDKIRTVYDYVCRTIRYDKVHRKNPYFYLRSTAYAGLIMQTATCQGYCVVLYRMLRSVGIQTRIVTGAGASADRAEAHAWNIVALDGVYYGLDATWDAGQAEYACFLRGTDGFGAHTPDAEFLTDSFLRQYPMAKTDYAAPTV